MDDEDGSSMAYLSSDDDMDMEEIPVEMHLALDEDVQPDSEAGQSSSRGNIEITLDTRKSKAEKAQKKRPVMSNAERLLRLDVHKLHTVYLLAGARARNKWLNDDLLRARLMSMTPMSLQTSFSMITKRNTPDAAKRGRLFETAVMRLTEWWSASFEILPNAHLVSRTFDQVQADLASRGAFLPPPNELSPEDLQTQLQRDLEERGQLEVIRSEKSLMKRALILQGSKDVSAQLFTALCRALDIPARLVVSIQSVPWQAKVGRPRPPSTKKWKGKGKEKAAEDDEDTDQDGNEEMEEVDIPVDVKARRKFNAFSGPGQRINGTPVASTSKGKEIAKPVIKLRKQKPQGQKLSSRKPSPGPPPGGYPPAQWTEVFSRPDGRWLPVDPVRYIVNKRKVFDPPAHDTTNRMVYVAAIEEDGYCRDVTARYANEFSSKTVKMQANKGKDKWWEALVGTVTRPFRLHRDDVEDEEIEIGQLTEGLPTSIVGFKDHPLYVLERHLKRDEVIHPLKEIGKFRGEAVYPRANVVALKTAENWIRTSGRSVRAGAQPMKTVKQRAVTISRLREIEVAGERGEEEVMQGMYAFGQTEPYVPPPIIDGVIPKNDFGNIDLYVPSMLPKGGVHIPFKGVAKIARKLDIDYAEAVTGFEFKKRRAFPILTGIVVAAENEQTLVEAYWESEQDAEKKERAKRQERVRKRWTRLIHGLQIRKRLQEQYGDREHAPVDDEQRFGAGPEDQPEEMVAEEGGFLLGADDVVKAYSLPRTQHPVVQNDTTAMSLSTLRAPMTSGFNPKELFMLDESRAAPADATMDVDLAEGDALEVAVPSPTYSPSMPTRSMGKTVPRTMQELAEDFERRELSSGPEDISIGASTPDLHVFIKNGATPDGQRKTRSKTASVNGSGKKSKASTSNTVRRSTRRRRNEESASESEGLAEPSQPSPLKRARASWTPARLAPSDRTLRTRKSKTDAQLREERESDAALRRALAE